MLLKSIEDLALPRFLWTLTIQLIFIVFNSQLQTFYVFCFVEEENI